MSDRRLLCAVGTSMLIHGLVLAFGSGMGAPAVEAPRLLEARLLQPVHPDSKNDERPAAPSVPRPARPVVSHAVVSHEKSAHSPPQVARPAQVAAPQPRLVTEARSDRTAPAVANTFAPAQAVVSVPSATPGPVAPLALSTGPAPVSYAPPSYGAAYLDNPKPSYPLIARRRGLEGTVRLDVRVSLEGIPISVRVRDSGGHESLDEAALNAVWHWRFVPARRGGEAVEASIVVPIRFRLAGDDAG